MTAKVSPPSSESRTLAPADERPIVLFDGVCNLCSAWVHFVLERDARGEFRFASLQSPAAAELLRAHGLAVPKGDPSSIVLLEGGAAFQRSTAVLRIFRRLGGALGWMWIFRFVPQPLRDAVYGLVARYRYRWFGKSEVCLVPTPELRARFLG